jgi:hypothetical protein
MLKFSVQKNPFKLLAIIFLSTHLMTMNYKMLEHFLKNGTTFFNPNVEPAFFIKS